MQQKEQPSSNVTDIEIQLITRINIKNERHMLITGCAILPNEHLLFANYNRRRNILEYSKEGNYISSIQVYAEPYDITVLDSERIAITYGYNGFFEILNYCNNSVEKKIETGSHCWGLSQSNGKIYIQLDKVECFDTTCKKLFTMAVAGDFHISASKTNLFCSNSLNNNVYCYDMHGQEVWKFRDDSLQSPLGVTHDRSGNVFVVGRKSRKLILIQHDGKTYKNLLNLKNYSAPVAVCYNKDKHNLLYCDKKGDYCALYKVLNT
ncbi:unnamed protein product [Mytilus coruscus]|uniref:TRIM2_3 n=1 Tax=Mytilus coruscus TaxID=42192 RepID=A0A6J8A571_MYTCO|nr:unnamed protein product [Mytilus coruscus]